MIRVGVYEVPAEASGGSVEVAGSGRHFGQREAIAVGRHVFPDRPEHAEIDELILARDVERERARERARHVQACDRRAERGCNLLRAIFFRNQDEQVREPRELLVPRPSRCELQIAV
jgi:hypothetical protein